MRFEGSDVESDEEIVEEYLNMNTGLALGDRIYDYHLS
jgi:hypothetical protein